jgi:acetylornithine deacetylase/succinyl-diaminopimelate desuccinylase-like protein
VTGLSTVPAFNSRLRTTCVATELQAGHAENALPQRAAATVNCRILPGVDPASVRADLAGVIDNPAVSITPVAEANPSPPSPLSEEVMAPIQEITEAMWPGVPVVPNMSTGATDGLYFRKAGIPVYGVSGLFADIDDTRAHGRDERVLVESFYDALEFLERLVRAYTTP